jgi:MOSC domain-containing protein YiiM
VSDGRLIAIARRPQRRAPMQQVAEGRISLEAGLAGDFKGVKHPRRQITVLAREAWEAALAELGSPDVAWTVRRANLLVAGVELPCAKGGILQVGPVQLEVTGQTYPCVRMDEAHQGLLKALAKSWRGGVTCRVLVGGAIAIGDAVDVLARPRQETPRLPR